MRELELFDALLGEFENRGRVYPVDTTYRFPGAWDVVLRDKGSEEVVGCELELRNVRCSQIQLGLTMTTILLRIMLAIARYYMSIVKVDSLSP